jgi:alpha-ribazole phosphatase
MRGPRGVSVDRPRVTTRIWLIRHGEPNDVQGRCYGALDIGLSATGRDQMERVAIRLQAEPLTAIYSSPRLRTIESARVLASFHQCGYVEDDDLREIDFGDFEGRTYDEIAASNPRLYRQWMDTPTKVQFPNGESFAQMRPRVLKAFQRILKSREGQSVAIVTHGGAIRILLAWVLQMPDECIFRLGQDYAAMNLVTWANGIPQVRSMNGCAG